MAENKNVVILGGLGLIGFEVTYICLLKGHNVTVVDQAGIDNDKKKKLEKYNTKFKFYKKKINKEFVNKFFNILKNNDSLINCLYIDNKVNNTLGIDKLDIQNFKNTISLNIDSILNLSVEFAKYLVKRKKGGSILNFGSIYSVVAQNPKLYLNTKINENLPYSFFKSGLVNFTKQLSATYSKYGIRTNLILPGGVRDINNPLQDSKFVKKYNSIVPIGRMARPDEIAYLAEFLISDYSTYISGAAIPVDGGWTAI